MFLIWCGFALLGITTTSSSPVGGESAEGKETIHQRRRKEGTKYSQPRMEGWINTRQNTKPVGRHEGIEQHQYQQ